MTIADAEKKIKIAWIVGIISGFVTLFFTLVAAASQGGVFDIQGNTVSLWNFLDVALIFLLTFGIYVKSRVAAVGMFIYSMISKLMVWGAAASVDGTVPPPATSAQCSSMARTTWHGIRLHMINQGRGFQQAFDASRRGAPVVWTAP